MTLRRNASFVRKRLSVFKSGIQSRYRPNSIFGKRTAPRLVLICNVHCLEKRIRKGYFKSFFIFYRKKSIDQRNVGFRLTFIFTSKYIANNVKKDVHVPFFFNVKALFKRTLKYSTWHFASVFSKCIKEKN